MKRDYFNSSRKSKANEKAGVFNNVANKIKTPSDKRVLRVNTVVPQNISYTAIKKHIYYAITYQEVDLGEATHTLASTKKIVNEKFGYPQMQDKNAQDVFELIYSDIAQEHQCESNRKNRSARYRMKMKIENKFDDTLCILRRIDSTAF